MSLTMLALSVVPTSILWLSSFDTDASQSLSTGGASISTTRAKLCLSDEINCGRVCQEPVVPWRPVIGPFSKHKNEMKMGPEFEEKYRR